MRAKLRSTMHEVKDLRSITDRGRPRETRLMPESQGVLPPPPVEERRSKQDQVKLVHQQRRGASSLQYACNVERPGGRALGCPVLYRRDPATIRTPNKGQSLCQLARLHPPVQGKLYAATSSPPERRYLCPHPVDNAGSAAFY